MEKVKVSICTCPNCYTVAATHFKQLCSIMSAKLKTQIILSGAHCPGDCTLPGGPHQIPLVQVDDQWIPDATPGEVIQAIREKLRAKKPERAELLMPAA